MNMEIEGSKKPVAIIIMNWNGARLLEQFLPSVCGMTDSTIADVIVADNGSTDDSMTVLKEKFGSAVKILPFDKNYGYAGGYNKAIKETDYKYTVLLNSGTHILVNREG